MPYLGIIGHTTDTCFFREYPDVNHSSAPWSDSAAGERWRARGYASYKPNIVLPSIGKTPHTMGRTESSVGGIDNIGGQTPHVHFEAQEHSYKPSRGPHHNPNRKREYTERRYQGGSGPASDIKASMVLRCTEPRGATPPMEG